MGLICLTTGTWVLAQLTPLDRLRLAWGRTEVPLGGYLIVWGVVLAVVACLVIYVVRRPRKCARSGLCETSGVDRPGLRGADNHAGLREEQTRQGAAAGPDSCTWEFEGHIVDVINDCARVAHTEVGTGAHDEETTAGWRGRDVLYTELPTDFSEVLETPLRFRRAGIADVYRQKLRLTSPREPDGHRMILLKLEISPGRDPLWVIGRVRAGVKEPGERQAAPL